MYHIKKYIKDLERERSGAYRHNKQGLFLDRNERTLPFNSEITKLLFEELTSVNLCLYPEIEPFYEKISQWIGFNRNEIFVTEGVDGAIKSIIQALTVSGKDNIVFPSPTFAMYPVYCNMFQVFQKHISYNGNYYLNIEEILSCINDNTSIVFLPNPNMPIEGVIKLDKIKVLAEYCQKRKVMLVLDEVYYPFSEITGVNLTKEYSNLLVMRSFSKAFGLAGIRLGYIVGNSKIIDYISRIRTGYESNSISIEVASFFIDRYEIVLSYVQEIKEGLRYLINELNHLGIEHTGGEMGNYIFINLKDPIMAQQIVLSLRQEDIYVRGNWPAPFDGGFSVAGAPKYLMKKFFEEFRKKFFVKKGES